MEWSVFFQKIRKALVNILVGILLVNCTPTHTGPNKKFSSSSVSEPSDELSKEELERILKGRELYAQSCMGCHGNIDSSTKKYRTTKNIAVSIRDVSEMNIGVLKNLSSSDILAISFALNYEGTVACQSSSPRRTQLHRLSNREYRNTIRDLLGVTSVLSAELPIDGVNSNGFDNDSSSKLLTTFDIEKLYFVTEKIVKEAFANGVPPQIQCTGACSSGPLKNLLRQAFRRPPTANEMDKYGQLVASESNNVEGLKKATLQALLSPHFLNFVIDETSSLSGEVHNLSQFELASRLSYFIWSSMPDKELLDIASKGDLMDQVILLGQIQRMLSDQKSKEFINNFFGAWIGFNNIDGLNLNAEIFPQFVDLRTDMKTETMTFISKLIENEKSISDLFFADYSYLNQRMSSFYNVNSQSTSNTTFVRTQLDGKQRSGIITHASVLASSNTGGNITNPIHRGIWGYERLFCGSLGDPPPEAEGQVLETGKDLSIKEGLHRLASKPSCTSCHSQINPIGLAFEGFDPIGAWRTSYPDGKGVETNDQLADGTVFSGPTDLLHKMGEGRKLEKCFSRYLVSYSVGRLLKPVEKCQVDSMILEMDENKMSLADIIGHLVKSKIFNQHSIDER